MPLVKILLEYGARVAVPAKTDKFGDDFDDWKKNGQLKFIEADFSTTEGIKKAYAEINDIFGKIDVLINCAAYGGGAGGKACDRNFDWKTKRIWYSPDDWIYSLSGLWFLRQHFFDMIDIIQAS